MFDIHLHSWTFRGQPFAKAIDAALVNGYRGIELHAGHFLYPAEPAQSIEQLAGRIRSAGLELIAVPLTVSATSESEYQAGLGAADVVLEAAAGCGGRLVNCMISPITGPEWSQAGSAAITAEQLHWTRRFIAQLAKLAERYDLTACLETHMVYAHDSTRAAVDLISGADSERLALTLDLANMAGLDHGEDWSTALSLAGPHIAYLHLKNHRNVGSAISYECDLARGDICWPERLAELSQRGPMPPICIEYSGSADPAEVARADFELVTEALSQG